MSQLKTLFLDRAAASQVRIDAAEKLIAMQDDLLASAIIKQKELQARLDDYQRALREIHNRANDIMDTSYKLRGPYGY